MVDQQAALSEGRSLPVPVLPPRPAQAVDRLPLAEWPQAALYFSIASILAFPASMLLALGLSSAALLSGVIGLTHLCICWGKVRGFKYALWGLLLSGTVASAAWYLLHHLKPLQ